MKVKHTVIALPVGQERELDETRGTLVGHHMEQAPGGDWVIVLHYLERTDLAPPRPKLAEEPRN